MFELAKIKHWWDVSRRYPRVREDHQRGVLKAMGYAHVLEHIDRHGPARVLEFGHGHGSTLFFLAAPPFELWALDAHVDVHYWTREEFQGRRAAADRMWPGVHFVDGLVGPGRNTLPSAGFDMLCSVSVLEEIPLDDVDGVVADAARLLRPGGLFVNSIDLTTLYTAHVERFFACHEKYGFRWLDPAASLPLVWDIHTVAFEDPCFVMRHYLGNQPDEGRQWQGNYATVLAAARKI